MYLEPLDAALSPTLTHRPPSFIHAHPTKSTPRSPTPTQLPPPSPRLTTSTALSATIKMTAAVQLPPLCPMGPIRLPPTEGIYNAISTPVHLGWWD
ncbi:uncharacterized protein LAJ45_02952 [Morchella importuna]|uniref:uncharacterized protein n=1 Tax=Morchella importuna TaxID=1174673 RepID=UPI001E8DC9C5|nr:uncharacterized protein LAJ45_02952 [Morchella importuna]KAH8152728.1 hypothetical protein LAJ45_02952 [Morchella importuna]